MALGEPGVLHGMRSYLLQDEDGNVKSVKQLVHNFEIVMDKDSRFAGKIRLNEFAQQPYL